MKPLAIIITTLALPLIGASVISCNNDKKVKAEIKNDKTTTNSKDTLIYNFQDASVPPPYHRSYSIRVTPGQVYFAISDYNQILLKDSLVLSKAAYDAFATTLNGLQIKNRKEVTGEGCTGGTSERLDLYAGSSKEVKGHTYFCGGKQYGDLEGDVVAAANLFKALIPDLSGKIDATRENN